MHVLRIEHPVPDYDAWKEAFDNDPVGREQGGVRGKPESVAARRERAECRVVVVTGEADLLEVVAALHAGGGLAHLLHRRQQQADQDGDDRNHHQQLNEREPPTCWYRAHTRTPSVPSDDGKKANGGSIVDASRGLPRGQNDDSVGEETRSGV
jgi:hypothetical protein